MSQSCHLCTATYPVNNLFNLMRRVGESRRLDGKSLLIEARNGDGIAVDQLMSIVHADLRRIVRGVMRSEGLHHALKPAAVVNESFWRLVQSRDRSAVQFDWQSRAHFLAIASHQIRLVLADYTRRQSVNNALSRLGMLLESPDSPASGIGIDVESYVVEHVLKELEKTDQGLVRILEMSCLGGMSSVEVALVEHSSIAKAKKDIEMAQDYLAKVVLASGLATREHNISRSR